MPHIAYIDPDEEIISVIGRLRKVSDSEVCFAVPKRALFLQSLVNLRLLEREAKKLGKKLCLVIPDEIGRTLAEKAGIETRISLEGIDAPSPKVMDAGLPARLSRADQEESSDGKNASSASVSGPVHSESIGSPSFFMRKESSVDIAPRRSGSVSSPVSMLSERGASDVSRTLPVRDRTPKHLTALNSSIASVPPVKAPAPLPDSSNSRVSFEFPAPKTSIFSPPVSSPTPPLASSDMSSSIPLNLPAPSSTPVSETTPRVSTPNTSLPRESSMASLYRKSEEASSSKPEFSKNPVTSSGRRMLRFAIFGFSALSVLVAIGVSVVIFVPKAEVTVLLKELSESMDVEVIAKVSGGEGGNEEGMIPLRLLEVEKDVSASFPGTGRSSVSDKRARGMVTISNSFGKDAQTLVATTRLETADGKVFRLVKGVTVPGAKETENGMEAGMISAEVSADKPGEDYNIEATSFTIPGLKGSAKFEKITAKSEKSFVGGGAGSEGTPSVSADDVLRAKEESERKLSESLRMEMEKELQPGEILLDDAFAFETLSSGAFPGAGAVAPSFDYRIRVSVRALVFSEEDFLKVVGEKMKTEISSEDIDIEYTVPRPDFAGKSLLVKARASLSRKADLDIDALKRDLLGKNLGDVQGIFSEYPNVEKIEVSFRPSFLTSRIPSRSSQVNVRVREE